MAEISELKTRTSGLERYPCSQVHEGKYVKISKYPGTGSLSLCEVEVYINSKSEIQTNQNEQNQDCSPMEGWELLSNWHLYPNIASVSYSEARDECKNLGANLVEKDALHEVNVLCLLTILSLSWIIFFILGS